MKYNIAVCFLFFTTAAFSQTFMLSGTVLDSVKQVSLPGANIQLFTTNSEDSRATVTNERGNFQFAELTAGGYKIKISYVGYNPQEKWIMLRNADRDLGNIILAPSTATLENIEVQAEIVPAVQNGDTRNTMLMLLKPTQMLMRLIC